MKIAAAITIAAAGFGGGMAYKQFRAYLREKDKQRDSRRKKPAEEQQATSVAGKARSQKQPRTRKKTAAKSKRNRGKESSEMEGQAVSAAAKE